MTAVDAMSVEPGCSRAQKERVCSGWFGELEGQQAYVCVCVCVCV